MPFLFTQHRNHIIALLAAFIFSGCGGGGSNDGGGTPTNPGNPQNPSNTISGIVAKGTPLAGFTVELLSVSSLATQGSSLMPSTTTDESGNYTITLLQGMTPPFLIKARDDNATHGEHTYPSLYSFALSAGTANITPLTALLVAALPQGQISSDRYALASLTHEESVALAAITQTDIDAARSRVVNYLAGRSSTAPHSNQTSIDASALSDFIATPMNPVSGDLYDTVLEQVQSSLIDGENILGLQLQMLQGEDAPANLSIPEVLNAGFVPSIECTYATCYFRFPSGTVDVPFSKQALIKNLNAQMQEYGFSYTNCSEAVMNGTLTAGTVRIESDESILRLTSADTSKTLSLPSTHTLNFELESVNSVQARIRKISAYWDDLGEIDLQLSGGAVSQLTFGYAPTATVCPSLVSGT